MLKPVFAASRPYRPYVAEGRASFKLRRIRIDSAVPGI
jgi:hypothetical protein